MSEKIREINDSLGDFVLEIPQLHEMRWYNSSNVLCNYMKKQEYLDLILSNMAIIPRFVIEPLAYLDLKEINKICFPMTCFCDIPFSKVSTHMSMYGSYGIGLDKISILEKYRVQPIHYINAKSPLAEDFKEAFMICKNNKFEGDDRILASYVNSTLMYMKPIYNYEQGDGGKATTYIYQDECEWRYIPTEKYPYELPLILPPKMVTEKARDIYSDVLAKHEECWLKFSSDEVKYIIVPDEIAAKTTIETIRNLRMDSQEKDILISKIEISRTFSENI